MNSYSLLIVLFGIVSSASSVVANEENDTCEICVELWENLQEVLEDPERRDEIENLLHLVCQALPQTEKTICEIAVNMYWPKLCDFVLEETPSDACSALGLCPRETSWSGGDGKFCVMLGGVTGCAY